MPDDFTRQGRASGWERGNINFDIPNVFHCQYCDLVFPGNNYQSDYTYHLYKVYT